MVCSFSLLFNPKERDQVADLLAVRWPDLLAVRWPTHLTL
jgi:hypothetical protein